MSESLWTPVSEQEVRDWRKGLKKGHVREINTARHDGWDTVTEEDGKVEVTPPVTSIVQAAPPREVADEIFGMVWNWAQSNPEAYSIMAQMLRASYPAEYGHLSEDELRSKLKEHAKTAARTATEKVYREKWDRGNNLDHWQGKAAMP